ncbi:MAG: 2-oxoglutarate dehydrogenase E1 component [Gammaproteobacteria bacterium]
MAKSGGVGGSGLGSVNAEFVDALYQTYLTNPGALSAEWRAYFQGFEQSGSSGGAPVTPHLSSDDATLDHLSGAHRLLMAYRLHGHRVARTNPLAEDEPERIEELTPEAYSLDQQALGQQISVQAIDPHASFSVREVIDIMERVYCGPLSAEIMHINDIEERRWIQSRLESTRGHWSEQHGSQVRKEVLEHLTAAEGLERHLHRRYLGQKRFSLEGAEALIPLLDELIQIGGHQGVTDMVVGMAHRGRLNVLVNILGKSPQELFTEFEGGLDEVDPTGSGDVKYHQGFYSDIRTDGGPVHVSLAFNPSHLEIVSPVVTGGVRARQDRLGGDAQARVVAVLIHGDAAFIGQGVSSETLNLAKTPHYGTGGTIHLVVNNQIGFTTSEPHEARSTQYCTDVAKLIQAPILHVNADDPDAVVFAAQLAVDYRQRFRNDVVIDLVCYRRHGHNEADEPMMTQPLMYKRIRSMMSTRERYARLLASEGLISGEDADNMMERYNASLEKGKVVVREFLSGSRTGYSAEWRHFAHASVEETVNTAVRADELQDLGRRACAVPDGFALQGRVKKILDERLRMLDGESPLDWGMAETLAYATLLYEGFGVRLSGQDSGRGTFAHRHAVLHDQNTGESHTPLERLFHNQPKFEVINSVLSELAVLGFEYGYATTAPKTLTLWEAQFGDFANGAQVVIDQFIASGFAKWGRFCALTLLLPHGHEGQGPEHSSARLERFLQLCAELNMRVWVPTTPAQFFHLLRHQILRSFRRPLVVMTPKSLLRHPESKSQLADFTDHQLQEFIPEQEAMDDARVRRVVLCSGKVYFDLLAGRRKRQLDDIAIVRVEQLYPFPRRGLAAELKRYPSNRELVWCQEEPRNQGAWYQIQHHLRALAGDAQSLGYAGRSSSASTACGYAKVHQKQQDELVAAALSEGLLKDHGGRLEDY